MGAYEIPGQRITLETGADLSAKRYYAVTVNSDGKAVVAGAGANIVGILQTPEEAGHAAQIMVNGISFAILGGTVAAGDDVSTDADGKIVKAATGSSATPVIGKCLAGGAANAIGSVLLK